MKTLDEYWEYETECVDCEQHEDGSLLLCRAHFEVVFDALLSLRRELLQ